MVRVVVLNYNGGAEVEDCIESLFGLDWPEHRREIVVVDNASTDGSPDRIALRHPDLRLIRNAENTGFSANNLALADLAGIDFVALVNPDATVDTGWLRGLVAAMSSDDVGAASPLMLLASRGIDVAVDHLAGCRVEAAEIDGHDALPASLRLWRLLPRAGVRDDTGHPTIHGAPLTLAAGESTDVTTVRLLVSAKEGDARWVDVEPLGPPYDIVNNAGIELRPHGYGADRGLGATDLVRFSESQEIFGWSGGGVLLRTAYLEDVGLFDPLFFLYYEDFDLSWRGRSRGWRYVFAPDAVMRHHLASSTVEGSSLFVFQTELNRLISVVTNAPASFAAAALLRFLVATLGYVRADVVGAVLRGRRPRWSMVTTRGRVVARIVVLAPTLFRRRRSLARRRTAEARRILGWIVTSG